MHVDPCGGHARNFSINLRLLASLIFPPILSAESVAKSTIQSTPWDRVPLKIDSRNLLKPVELTESNQVKNSQHWGDRKVQN